MTFGNPSNSDESRVMTRLTKTNMAEFFVALLTASIIFLLSLLFWKWINRRNRLINEELRQMRVSRPDVRKNRLKRFEKSYEKDDHSTPSNSEGTEVLSGESTVSGTEDELILQDINNSGVRLSSSGVLSLEADTDVSSSGNDVVKSEASSSVAKFTVSKPNNRRKWVTLSAMDDNIEAALPVTRPLVTLQELRAWREGFDEFNISSIRLRKTSNELEKRPRTLVCHDMKGGYLEDRFVQGYSSSECYRLYHWQYIDIFVYFSHNIVTIPPPSWTNTGHRHGVRVLGTFITEWEDGAKRCVEMFTDQYSYQAIANQLIQIAKYYGFDGWLVNIENPIQPAQVNNLAEFMNYLTSEMHQHISGSLVIWYDSVTYKGELKWQNELNPENRIFFDVCDGIFLNYIWNENNLIMSARGAGQERRHDVYVGVDVFGRGCFGGGGWNTNKATNVIKKQDLSMALFAPGWVYENYQSSFKVNQDKFWTSISSDCTIHTLGSGLPFVTSFCQGYGEKVFRDGKVILGKPWTHLSAQQLQPSYTNHIYSLGDQHGVRITALDHSCQDAYNGGGCLLLRGSTKITQTSSKAIIRLFKTDLLLPSTILISFTTKLEPHNSMDVALQLHMDKTPTYIMLCPGAEDARDSEDETNIDSLNRALLQRYGVTRSTQLNSDNMVLAVAQEHYRLFAPVSGEQHDKLHTMCSAEPGAESLWCTRYYLLAEKDLKGSRVKEIRLVLMNRTEPVVHERNSTQFQLFLGEVKIIDAVSLRRSLPTATSLHCRESNINVQTKDDNMVSLSLTLSWAYDNSDTNPWERFEVYYQAADGSTTFLGVSFAMSYFVSDLDIPSSQNEVKFIVQAVNCAQLKQSLENCPTITIHWT